MEEMVGEDGGGTNSLAGSSIFLCMCIGSESERDQTLECESLKLKRKW